MKTLANTVATIFIVMGFIMLFGAAGESDMSEAAGEFLPLVTAIKKVGVGIGLLLLGMFIKRRQQ